MDVKSYVEYEMKKSNEELASLFKIPVEKVLEWVENPDDLSYKYWDRIIENSNMNVNILEAYERPFSKPLNFDFDYLKRKEKEEISKILCEFETTYTDNRVTKYREYMLPYSERMMELIKKPKVAFLGKSDAGKSSMINSFLGIELMPASWTPVTSTIVYLKHIDDKPRFMNETTYIFKKCVDKKTWDEINLYDEAYCQKYLIESGGIELLCKYATNHDEIGIGSVVVFLDVPLLKNCDIIDVPGIISSNSSDNESAKSIVDLIDMVLYLSPANGFISEGDIDYIKLIYKNLQDKKRLFKSFRKSMFFVASQADTLNEKFDENLTCILDKGADRLYKCLLDELLIEKITLESFRKQFYAYSIKIRFEERTKLEKTIQEYFKNYYELMQTWMTINTQAYYDEIFKDYEVIKCFKENCDKTKKFRNVFKRFKKLNKKISKKLLKSLKNKVLSFMEKQQIVICKGISITRQKRELKIKQHVNIKQLFEEYIGVSVKTMNEKFPCEFYNRAYQRFNFLYDRISNELTKLEVQKSAYRNPIFAQKVQRRLYSKKTIKEKILPEISVVWNEITEYIFCLYIYSKYENYEFNKFHCFTTDEIYDSHNKNEQVKRIMKQIIDIIK